MVRQWQELFYDRRYAATCLLPIGECHKGCTGAEQKCPSDYIPNFVKVAEAYSAVGIRVEKKADVVPALEEAIKDKKRPVVLDFKVAGEENVYPMVPAGASLKQMINGIS